LLLALLLLVLKHLLLFTLLLLLLQLLMLLTQLLLFPLLLLLTQLLLLMQLLLLALLLLLLAPLLLLPVLLFLTQLLLLTLLLLLLLLLLLPVEASGFSAEVREFLGLRGCVAGDGGFVGCLELAGSDLLLLLQAALRLSDMPGGEQLSRDAAEGHRLERTASRLNRQHTSTSEWSGPGD